MLSKIMAILVPSLFFALIAFLLPGFKVTGSKLNYVWLTIGYMILMAVSKFFLVVPIVGLLGFLVGWIPLLGSVITGVAGFIATFILSMIMLMGMDYLMKDFKMEGNGVAFKASALLAIGSFIGNLPVF